MQIDSSFIEDFDLVKKAEKKIALLDDEVIHKVLNELADLTEKSTPTLLKANKLDLIEMDPTDPKYDRLELNPERIQGICNDLRKVAELPSPLRKILERRKMSNGLIMKKISVPMGTIGIVFESRPNVTFDVFALCFKSGNACILKGSRDAHHSNQCIIDLIHSTLSKHNIPIQGAYLAPSERTALLPVLEATEYVDVIIPRGSQGLIDYVRTHSKVPVIETGAGIVHTYIDVDADLEKAKAIVRNAKTRRVSVCNALDTLIIHNDILNHLPYILEGLDRNYNLLVYADQLAYETLENNFQPTNLYKADSTHFGTEFLSMKMSVKCVDHIDAALEHIDLYSSKHSEAIISENKETLQYFQDRVDAAVVYTNASTAFTDGGQFGMGAEIGISTQKLHARGPMALPELTSYKWIVQGNGQVRN